MERGEDDQGDARFPGTCTRGVRKKRGPGIIRGFYTLGVGLSTLMHNALTRLPHAPASIVTSIAWGRQP